MSGLAMVLSSNHLRVQFPGMSVTDAALLVGGGIQRFKYQAENLFYPIASVISIAGTPEVELQFAYNGLHDFDEPTSYLVYADFTPKGFILLAPGDVDIRHAISYNAELADTLLDTAGPGGGAFVKQGIKAVTAGTFSVTVTPPSGSFPTPPYSVHATGSWISGGIAYSARTTTEFVLTWAFEVPAGGAEISWGVV